MKFSLKPWVRPFISVVAVCGITAGFFLGKIGADVYVPIMAIAITFWYQSREEEKKP